MTDDSLVLPDVLRHSPVRVLFGSGRLAELGERASEEGASRVLLVTDPGIIAAGYVAIALKALEDAGLQVTIFDGVRENPTTEQVRVGVDLAREKRVDFLIGLGGGSSIDCAKGINLILTNGGEVADYWGEGKTRQPMLPMIAVPTTAGTGSEAQSFALIADAATHQKMACGDRRLPTEGGLRPRVAVLDWALTRSQPPLVAAAAGIDAVAHALETAGSTARSEISLEFSRQAWRLLESGYERALRNPTDDRARAGMLLGAHLAGCAIEQSMLGAAHACANPLTARFGVVHGFAVGLMLPHVVRFNANRASHNPYEAIDADPMRLASRVERWLGIGRIPQRLCDCGVRRDRLPAMARAAAAQWTAGFNPVAVDESVMLSLYESAYS